MRENKQHNSTAFEMGQRLTLFNESYRQSPYQDSSNQKYLTIGIGRNLDTVGISFDEAVYLQANDLRKACDFLAANVPWYINMSDARQAVFIDMVFNLGGRGFLTFKKMLEACKTEKYDVAADELCDSRYCDQVGLRALRNATILRTGVFPSLS